MSHEIKKVDVNLLKPREGNPNVLDAHGYNFLLKEIKKDETLVYADYKQVGSLLMPYRIESSSPKRDSDYVMIINKIETNKVFPANTFKF